MKPVPHAILSTPYAFFGFLGLCIVSAALILGLQGRWVPEDISFLWQVVTGVGLVAAMTFQWVLFYNRWTGQTRSQDLIQHRWVGVTTVVLFGLHAARIGHTWMLGLTILFLLIGVTGILNKQIMRYQTRGAYLTWLALHIGLSVAIIPVIAVHIWVALVY